VTETGEKATVEVLVDDLLALDRVLREIPQNLLISESEGINRLMQAIPLDAFRAAQSGEKEHPLFGQFAKDIAVWARVHAHHAWTKDDPAIQNLAHRLCRVVDQSGRKGQP
jgi:hypothetical protein